MDITTIKALKLDYPVVSLDFEKELFCSDEKKSDAFLDLGQRLACTMYAWSWPSTRTDRIHLFSVGSLFMSTLY